MKDGCYWDGRVLTTKGMLFVDGLSLHEPYGRDFLSSDIKVFLPVPVEVGRPCHAINILGLRCCLHLSERGAWFEQLGPLSDPERQRDLFTLAVNRPEVIILGDRL